MIADHWLAISIIVSVLVSITIIGVVYKAINHSDNQSIKQSIKQSIYQSKLRWAKVRQSKVDQDIDRLKKLLDQKSRQKVVLDSLTRSISQTIHPSIAREQSVSRTRRSKRQQSLSQSVNLSISDDLNSSSEDDRSYRRRERRQRSISLIQSSPRSDSAASPNYKSSPSHQSIYSSDYMPNNQSHHQSKRPRRLSIDTSRTPIHPQPAQLDNRSMRSVSASPVQRSQRHRSSSHNAQPHSSQALQPRFIEHQQTNQSHHEATVLPPPPPLFFQTTDHYQENDYNSSFDRPFNPSHHLSSPSPIPQDSLSLSPSPISMSMNASDLAECMADSSPMSTFDLSISMPSVVEPVEAHKWTRRDSRSLMKSTEHHESFNLFVSQKREKSMKKLLNHPSHHPHNLNNMRAF